MYRMKGWNQMYLQTDYPNIETSSWPLDSGPQVQPFQWGEFLTKACLIGGTLWLLGKAFEERPRRKRRPARRDTYLYRLRASRRSVYFGISNQPERRCAEHLASGKRFDAMEVLGVAISRNSALSRERATLDNYCQRYGQLPHYNKI